MDMVRVSSSNIHSVGYLDNDLYVQFHSGYTYKYHNVPVEHFSCLLGARSKGTYLHSFIKSYYAYTKLS